MQQFTQTQWIFVGLVLVLGWLLGLLSRSSTKPLRERLADAEARREASEASLAAANRRIGELEYIQRRTPQWGYEGGDNLTLVNGIGPDSADRLRTEGISSFAGIAAITEEETAALEERIGRPTGTIVRERWREQAYELRDRSLANR